MSAHLPRLAQTCLAKPLQQIDLKSRISRCQPTCLDLPTLGGIIIAPPLDLGEGMGRGCRKGSEGGWEFWIQGDWTGGRGWPRPNEQQVHVGGEDAQKLSEGVRGGLAILRMC